MNVPARAVEPLAQPIPHFERRRFVPLHLNCIEFPAIKLMTSKTEHYPQRSIEKISIPLYIFPTRRTLW